MSDVLDTQIHAGGMSKRLGDVTLAEVRARAEELREATGWGPTARIAPVARAWAELARRMQRDGASRVADLSPDVVGEYAGPLWVRPPW